MMDGFNESSPYWTTPATPDVSAVFWQTYGLTGVADVFFYYTLNLLMPK